MNGPGRRQTLSRVRVAWTVLLISFAVFVTVAVALPLSVNAFLQNADQNLSVSVQANEGTVSIDDGNGAARAALPGDVPQPVAPVSMVLTDATATGLLLITPPSSSELLARVQLYSGTVLRVLSATTPRYRVSQAPQSLELDLTGGRIRMVVANDGGRPFEITLRTPHGDVSVTEPGEYSLVVNNEATQVTVQRGTLLVTAQGIALRLDPAQRAEMRRDAPPLGPLAAERNLIANGGFRQRWDQWVQLAWNIERADQPSGELSIRDIFGERGLHVRREGEGHADVGIRQVINQDVTDYASLLLEIDLRILGQTLNVCGNVGSECPIIVRLEYDDVNGAPQVWQQGFFASGNIDPASGPDVCLTCPPPRFEHVRVTAGQFSFFRAELINDLQRKGMLPPRRINSLTLIASGHSFEVEVLDVALVAQETAGP